MRYILSAICLSIALMLQAQHLKFMGIPIDGTISTFQTKLQAKGFTLIKYNNSLPAGVRGFEGTFAGNKCNVYVKYIPRTKKVYAVRVATEQTFESRSDARGMFQYYKKLLDTKYEGTALTSDMLEDYQYSYTDEFALMVAQPPIQEGSKILGFIQLIIDELDTYYDTEYYIAITYTDSDNGAEYDQELLRDM